MATAHIVEREKTKQRLASEIISILEAHSGADGAAPLPPQVEQEVHARMLQLRDALGPRYPEVLQRAIEMAETRGEPVAALQSGQGEQQSKEPQVPASPPPTAPPAPEKSPYDLLIQALGDRDQNQQRLQQQVNSLELQVSTLRAEAEEARRKTEADVLLAQKREQEACDRARSLQLEIESARQREDTLTSKLQAAADEIDFLRARIQREESRYAKQDAALRESNPEAAGQTSWAPQSAPSRPAEPPQWPRNPANDGPQYPVTQQREARDRNRNAGMATNFNLAWDDQEGRRRPEPKRYRSPPRSPPHYHPHDGTDVVDMPDVPEPPARAQESPRRRTPEKPPTLAQDTPAQESPTRTKDSPPLDPITAACRRVAAAYADSDHLLTEEEFERAVARDWARAEQAESTDGGAMSERLGRPADPTVPGRRDDPTDSSLHAPADATGGSPQYPWARPSTQLMPPPRHPPMGTSSFISADASSSEIRPGPWQQRSQISDVLGDNSATVTAERRRYEDLQQRHLSICVEKDQCQEELDRLEQRSNLGFRDKVQKKVLEQRLEDLKAKASSALRELREMERRG